MVRQCLNKVLIGCCFLKNVSYGVSILGTCKIGEFTHAMKKIQKQFALFANKSLA